MTKPRGVTVEELATLRERFYTEDGKLLVKTCVGRRCPKVGQEVGCLSTGGYLKVGLAGRLYSVHRIIYYLVKGFYPTLQIDHINGNRSDNHPDNLREVSHAENHRSFRTKSKGASSKFRGVCWDKVKNKWVSSIGSSGSAVYLGYFENEFEAAMAYNIKALELGFNKEAFNDVFSHE
jgi:hypothetical protein